MMSANRITSIVQRIGGWVARLVLSAFVFLTVYMWLDVLVFQPEEYERLIGGEAGCGKFKAYCSWRAFVLDSVPDFILSILAVFGMLWRRLPGRELTLGVLALAVCGYVAWSVYSAQVEASLS